MLLYDILRYHRARKAITTKLLPWIELVQGESIEMATSRTWFDPYALGFLAMLVTRLLEEEIAEPLDPDALGLGQVDILAELTGLPTAAIGPELCQLSAASDAGFLSGARDADRVLAGVIELEGSFMSASLCSALICRLTPSDCYSNEETE